VTIVTRNVPAASSSENDLVEVSVRDTGVGIPPAAIGRVFDPFFTTKPPGQGTGLGLSMVHGFVGQSGGRVEISSEVGSGTRVQLLLPRARGRPAAAPIADAVPVVRGHGNILLVEDNAELGEMAATLLRELGYVVERAETPAKALEKLNSFRAHLVFSDLLMPGGMNGVEFAREVRRRYPDVEILLTSGDAGAFGSVDQSEFVILQKPYHLDALTAAIRRMLSRRLATEDATPAAGV
jgi:CheY-like chemotaxis protein